jgi:LmbE family N-acetylglucosaminyl deacetylase
MKEGNKLLTYDFVLVSEEEAKALREEEAKKAMEALGRRVKLLDGLPVPDVD